MSNRRDARERAKRIAEKVDKLIFGGNGLDEEGWDEFESWIAAELEEAKAEGYRAGIEEAAMVCRNEYGSDMDQSWVDF